MMAHPTSEGLLFWAVRNLLSRVVDQLCIKGLILR
jgi:hypothetical protein